MIAFARVLLLCTAMLLAACRSELLTALEEADANEALAVLLAAGIPADKVSPDGGKTWTLQVPDARVVRSLDLLRDRGLPRKHFASLGELFKKDGLISTPVEERVRFVHGVSQELSETLSRMDGVVVARVHIVLPNNDPLNTSVRPSSASVFVKHRPDASIAALVSPIKNLVAHSVEGLSYEQVSLTFVAADPIRPDAGPPETGSKLPAALLMGSAGMLLGVMALLGWVWVAPGRAQRAAWPLPVLHRWLTRFRTPSGPETRPPTPAEPTGPLP